MNTKKPVTMAKTINSQAVRELAALLDETGLTEIEYASGDVRIRVARQPAAQIVSGGGVLATAAAPSAAVSTAIAAVTAALPEPDPGDHPGAVKSPMVGTVYMAPAPGTAAFVAVGDAVREGQTLLLIEAMKTYNEIKAPRAGVVRRILVKDKDPVEFGEPLLIVE